MLISVSFPPINSTNSSWQIFTINWDGETDFKTSRPSAFSFTVFVKSFAVLKLTSASNKARRTSFNVSATFISVICPWPLRTLNALSNFSVRFSNMVIEFYACKNTKS